MNEKWKSIAGFEEHYEVSNMGNVRNVVTGRCLSLKKDKDGYLQVGLSASGVCHTKKVHRLVADAFIPNPLNLPTVNHINEIKSDNSIENLEWASYYRQIHHGTRDDRARQAIASEAVIQMDVSGNIVNRYESVRLAAKEMGRKPESLIDCIKGRKKMCAGFFWAYENPNNPKILGRKKNKGIAQLDDSGNQISHFPSIRSAARKMGISPSSISLCLSGKRERAAGFRWIYDENDIDAEYLRNIEYEKKIPILQYDKDGNFLCRHESVSIAAQSVKKSTGDICRCLKGRRETCGGYQWKYA